MDIKKMEESKLDEKMSLVFHKKIIIGLNLIPGVFLGLS